MIPCRRPTAAEAARRLAGMTATLGQRASGEEPRSDSSG